MAIQTKNSTETTRNSRNNHIVLGWRNIKTTILQAADESLERYIAISIKFKNLQDQEDNI